MDTEFKIYFADQLSDALLEQIAEGKWHVNDPDFRSRLITISRIAPVEEPKILVAPEDELWEPCSCSECQNDKADPERESPSQLPFPNCDCLACVCLRIPPEPTHFDEGKTTYSLPPQDD